MSDWGAIRSEYEQGDSLRMVASRHGLGKSTIADRKVKEQWTQQTDRKAPAPIRRKGPDTPVSGQSKKPTRAASRQMSDALQQQEPLHTDCTPEKKEEPSTKDRQRLFLDAYAEHANVLVAARAAGISRRIVYEWLEKDEDFSFAYHLAKEDAKDVLRAEIFRRAHDGWEEPVYQQGSIVGTVRKYDTTLLIFHAKMLMPEYREKATVDVTATVSGTVEHVRKLHALSDEELDILERLATKAMGEHGN